jgi:hypothetical protein
MKTKVLAFMGILLALGFVLHQFAPGFFFGMKPDILLSMLFIGIILFPQPSNVLLLGLGTAVISALTTTFPGGQIPNLIDKPITAFAFLGIYLLIGKYGKNVIAAGVLSVIGTMISGIIFLSSALMLVGLPGEMTFVAGILTVVLPATAINTLFVVVGYPIIQSIAKRTNIAM